MSEDESVVFVFYKINPDAIEKDKYWIYQKKFPKGWDWSGKGYTRTIEYPNEEQFDGPKHNKIDMRNYLDNYFSKLKNKGAILKYKIRYSYLP